MLTFHDQYRDYYVDAPSYDPQFAIHEEDEKGAPQAFPGTRFGISKEGRIPFMRYWDGGKQGFLNSRFMLGHLVQNYEWLMARGVRPDGAYLDVFGIRDRSLPAGELWRRLAGARTLPVDRAPIDTILRQGTLSSRLVRAAGARHLGEFFV